MPWAPLLPTAPVTPVAPVAPVAPAVPTPSDGRNSDQLEFSADGVDPWLLNNAIHDDALWSTASSFTYDVPAFHCPCHVRPRVPVAPVAPFAPGAPAAPAAPAAPVLPVA